MALNDPAINCTNQTITFEELLLASIGTDADSNPTLRVINSAATGDYLNCNNNSQSVGEALKGLFGLTASGKIALRVSITDVP